MLDRAARTGRPPDDDVPGRDPPLLHEVRAEGEDDLPGRDLARQGLDDEVVLHTEDVPSGVAGLALEPGGGGPGAVEDAVGEVLLPPPDQSKERLAGRGAAGPAVLPGRLPCHGSVPPVEVVGALESPDDPEVVLPPDLGLPDADGADPERRRTPEHDTVRIGYRWAFLDRPEEVAHPGPLDGVRLDDIEAQVHLPDPLPEDLLLGLGDEVDPGHDRDVGEGEHRRHLQGRVRARDRGEDDDPEPLRRVGGAAEAESGALDQEKVGALPLGPGDGIAHHHHPGVVRAEVAGVDLPRRDAELGREFLVLERPDDVDL